MSSTNDHYRGALLEAIDDKFQVIVEAVSGLTQTAQAIDVRLERVEEQVKVIDGRLRVVESTVDRTEKRLDRVEKRLDGIDERLDRVEENTALIPPIAEAVHAMSTDLDDHEHRITKLERHAA